MSTTGSEIFCTLKANMCVNELYVILQILKVPFWLVFEVQKKMWNPRNWMWCSENDGKNFFKTHKTSKTSWCKERCCKKNQNNDFLTRKMEIYVFKKREFSTYTQKKLADNHMFCFNFWNFLEIHASHHVVSFFKIQMKHNSHHKKTAGIFTMVS